MSDAQNPLRSDGPTLEHKPRWRGVGVLVAIGVLLLLGAVYRGGPLIQMWLHPCYDDFVRWRIGGIDLATTAPQRFSFVFQPKERSPEVFSIELRDWPPSQVPSFGYRISILDGTRLVGEEMFTAEGNECNWHQPNRGVAAMSGGSLCTGQDLQAGKTYTVVFQVLQGAGAPPGAMGTLYGGFVTDRKK